MNNSVIRKRQKLTTNINGTKNQTKRANNKNQKTKQKHPELGNKKKQNILKINKQNIGKINHYVLQRSTTVSKEKGLAKGEAATDY